MTKSYKEEDKSQKKNVASSRKTPDRESLSDRETIWDKKIPRLDRRSNPSDSSHTIDEDVATSDAIYSLHL